MRQELIHHLSQKKFDLANLQSNVDKFDIDKLKNVPTNLSNLIPLLLLKIKYLVWVI